MGIGGRSDKDGRWRRERIGSLGSAKVCRRKGKDKGGR